MSGVSLMVTSIAGTTMERAISWLGVVLFGGGAFVLLWRLMSGRARAQPYLVFEQDGFMLGVPSGVTVRWDEIDDLTIRKMFANRFLEVHVRDLSAIAARTGRMGRFALRANPVVGSSPISIAASMLPIRLEELVELIDERRARQAIEPQ